MDQRCMLHPSVTCSTDVLKVARTEVDPVRSSCQTPTMLSAGTALVHGTPGPDASQPAQHLQPDQRVASIRVYSTSTWMSGTMNWTSTTWSTTLSMPAISSMVGRSYSMWWSKHHDCCKPAGRAGASVHQSCMQHYIPFTTTPSQLGNLFQLHLHVNMAGSMPCHGITMP